MVRLARVTPATVDVLRSLLSATEPTWGLRIVTETDRPAGSVYPILARLEEGGWVVSRWADDEARGPRRRLYELSDDGRSSARRLLVEIAAKGSRADRRASASEPGLGLA